ncbi:MAG: hypothetical protein HN352_02055 [Bacteroidetes bacterium]|nr:hypothetical protein [Bacteroidota bacterium]MBT3750834.1 hypothetical protein [Bacteroidota bacterium]MBT4398242.1 hypothetical protein [Bacteroidota bacterium]MBT4409027.1 hypothetical protein [Bacteroidota bacterium]MBT5428224.1 hypothetical protein [Bacteroidota bacterium]
MALKDALEKLDAAVKDLTSLHVQTFTGTLSSKVDAEKGFANIEETVKAAKTNGDIKLVAEALVKFDGDSYNFVTNDSANAPLRAFEVHKSAVETGLNNRMALLNMFKGIIIK